MKTLAMRLAVALTTFVIGVWLTTLMFSRPTTTLVAVGEAPKYELVEIHSDCGAGGGSRGKREETPEEKAVRLAEEFVARNGYTDLPPDRDNLSYESIEWESNLDEMLKQRHDTLERKAYGIYYSGRMGQNGWTVVFRPTLYRCGNALLEAKRTGMWGRAVTMDENFENLRVEHKDFTLTNVHKRF